MAIDGVLRRGPIVCVAALLIACGGDTQKPRPATPTATATATPTVKPVDTRAFKRLEREFARITLPVLILHGTADKATRPEGSQQFFDAAGSADKELKLYDGYAHDLLNDLGRAQVMDDIVGWIEARLPQRVRAEMPVAT